jgi:hypothetical protein
MGLGLGREHPNVLFGFVPGLTRRPASVFCLDDLAGYRQAWQPAFPLTCNCAEV